MKFLGYIDKVIFQSSRLKLIILLVAIQLIHTGIWYIPNIIVSVTYSQNPFVMPFKDPATHYLWWNWLSIISAWLIGATSFTKFVLLHAAYAGCFVAFIVMVLFSRLEEREARISSLIFFSLPVSGTAFYWISTDGLTLLLLGILIASAGIPLATFAAGIAVGMQHFEQGLFALGVLLACSVVSRDRSLGIFSVLGLTGIMLGKLLLIAIVAYFKVDIVGNRGTYFVDHGLIYLNQFWLRGQTIVWATFGIAWFVIVRRLDIEKDRLAVITGLVLLVGLMPFVGDQTRVFAAVSLPFMAFYILLNMEFLTSVKEVEAGLLFLAFILIPYPWAWGGMPRLSVLPFDMHYLMHKLFGLFDLPADLSVWPWV